MSKAKNLATFGDNVDSSGNLTDLNVDSNTLVVDGANNRVGIGTAPNKKLHVYRNDSNTDAQIVVEQAGAGDATLNFLKTGVYAWMTGIDNTDNKYKISGTGDDLNTNNYLAITTSGKVGIGTSSPTANLHVKRDDSLLGAMLELENDGAGDANITFTRTGIRAYAVGIDGTDNSFRIARSAGLGTDDALTISSGGNVGIGTSSPDSKLHVNNGSFTQQLTDSTNLWTDISSGANPYSPMSNELVIRNDAVNVTNSMASIFFRAGQTTSGLEINTARIAAVREAGIDTSLAFSTRATSVGHTEKMRITSDGNVGIGTSSPSAPLDVAGNTVLSADTTETRLIRIGNGRSGNGYSYVDLVGDATYTDYGLRMIRNNTGADATSDINHRGTGALRISAVDLGSVQLKTNNSNRFQIDSTGRIQMVTSNLLTDGEGSNFNVSINGYVGVSSSLVTGVGSGAVALSINDGYGNANLTFNHHSGTPDVTGNSLRIETNVDSTTAANITFEGKSTTTAGTAVALNFMAVMYADTGNMTIGGSLTQNSDLRIKKDLQIIPDALDKVKTLNGYTYTRIDRDSEFQQTGCVAQEVQAVLPEAVTVGEDEQQTLSIAYGSMVGLLVEAIKELEAKVAALESGA